MEKDKDFLEHHGIKGQKWGVRRTPEQLGNRIKSGAKKVKSLISNKRSERASKVRKKEKRIPLKKMSDKELEKRLSRLRKETEYRRLSKEARGRGKNLVMDVLERSGKNVLTDLTTSEMRKAVKKIFKDVQFSGEGEKKKNKK